MNRDFWIPDDLEITVSDNNSPVPGTILWIAPFFNRSGFGTGARAIVSSLHRVGARIRILSVGDVEPGIDDCDLDLIKSLEKTVVTPPVTTIISHVPSHDWLKIKIPEPNLNIMATTVFDCSSESGAPPDEMLAACRAMDQIWLHVVGEPERFIAAGFHPDMIKTLYWPHPWLENPAIPPVSPEPDISNRPFRFLNISLFLPRRRWNSLIAAYLSEFKADDNVELYLKVSFPSWHPIVDQPKRDLLNMIDLLRQKTCSDAKITLDEDIGTRLGILNLVDSCNAYVSTDTAPTAPISEARVRKRLLIVPEGFFQNLDNGHIGIKVDPSQTAPMTREMLFYQPNHKGSSMPLIDHRNVRRALRLAYLMTGEERRHVVANMTMVPGPAETVPPMIQAIKDGWVYKMARSRIELQRKDNFGIVWEGPQFSYHSLALINRELSLRLMNAGFELSIHNTAKELSDYKIEHKYQRLASMVNRSLTSPVGCHIRHQWPPDFTPPDEGHWIMIQPWEYGSLPKEWVTPMRSALDEIWVPSTFVRESFIRSGIPDEIVQVIPNGVDTGLFRPKAPSIPLKTKKKYRFLFVGGTIWRKGPDVLLRAYHDAFTSRDDVCLVIKDMGKDDIYNRQTYKDTIRRWQEQEGLPEIEYLDADISIAEMPGLYTACHCLVHPFRAEGFGLPIIEAMACGLPVIVSGYGASMDFCNEENAFLIETQEKYMYQKSIGDIDTIDFPWYAEPDRNDLIRLMRYVVTHPEIAEDKGHRGFTDILENYTWDKVSQRVIERLRAVQNQPIRRFTKP